MKSFSRVALTTLTIVVSAAGLAAAQPKADAKAPAKVEPKVDAKAPAKVDAKVDAKAPAKADPAAPAKAEKAPPKPPQEVTDMMKKMAGTWKCTGSHYMEGTAAPMTATMKSKGDLDGFWIHDSFEAKMGKFKFKFESFMTYDAGSKKWRNVMVDNMGSQSVGTSDGMKDGKMDINMDSVGGMGTSMFRDHIDATDPKLMKMWGEASMDKGKTWNKVYEQSCKK